MTQEVVAGAFAHVVGTFDLTSRIGTIDYVTSVKVAQRRDEADEDGQLLHLRGLTAEGKVVFDVAVHPQHNSCAPDLSRGTFEVIVPAHPELQRLVLEIEGEPAASFRRGDRAGESALSLGPPDPAEPNRMRINAVSGAAPSEGVSYTVQAKASEAGRWETIAVGLPVPDSSVDINQFPGANEVEVRVLRSDGFSEDVIFQERRRFQ
jgi:hypothetical protein